MVEAPDWADATDWERAAWGAENVECSVVGGRHPKANGIAAYRGDIYVVDSLDRDRVDRARAEFESIINDPFMRNSAILVFAPGTRLQLAFGLLASSVFLVLHLRCSAYKDGAVGLLQLASHLQTLLMCTLLTLTLPP